MALLQGQLDPLRFNSTTIASKIYHAMSGGNFGTLVPSLQNMYLDAVQEALDEMLAEGIIK